MLIVADQQDRANFNSLLKILSILVIKLQGGKIRDLKESIADENYNDALDFIDKFSDDNKSFRNLYKNILKASSDVAEYAEPFLSDLRKMINDNRLKHDLESLSTDSKEVLEPILTLINNPDSDRALSQLSRKIGLLREPAITKKFIQVFKEISSRQSSDDDDKKSNVSDKAIATTMADVSKQIKDAAFKLSGKKDKIDFTTEEKQKFRQDETKKPILQLYEQLRKRLNDIKLNAIKDVVSASGKEHIPMKELVKGLEARGVPVNYNPKLQKSSIVHMNLNGQLTDPEGRVADKQGINPNVNIIINKNYSHTERKNGWLFYLQNPSGPSRAYTIDKVVQRKTGIFDKVREMRGPDIKKVKRKWRSHMDGDKDKESTVFANMAEFLYWTTSRPGAKEGMTAGSRTYGAANFLVRHVVLPSGDSTKKLIISYPIKGGKLERFKLTSNPQDLPDESDAKYAKKLIKFIVAKAKEKGKGPDDIVFTINGKRINTDKFNAYIKALGSTITGHKFRTLRGTELAERALELAKEEVNKLKKGKKPLTKSAVDGLFMQALTVVGDLLGHVRRTKQGNEESTGDTAIKSYVDPKLMVDWYRDIGFAPNTKVINAAKSAGIEV